MSDLFMQSDAILSECGRFRYALKRKWAAGPTMTFIMLNPSTADASEDDPTIRRCMGFARREFCGGIRVENLYGLRATDPDEMFRHGHTSIGGTNRFIRGAAVGTTGPVVAAWGADKRAQHRASQVSDMLADLHVHLKCLGKTKSGAPRHPLYIRADAPLIDYP